MNLRLFFWGELKKNFWFESEKNIPKRPLFMKLIMSKRITTHHLSVPLSKVISRNFALYFIESLSHYRTGRFAGRFRWLHYWMGERANCFRWIRNLNGRLSDRFVGFPT